MRCHMNSLALVEFTWPCQMAIKMDLVTTKFDHHHWMVNKMGLIINIRFDCCHQMEIEKGEYDKPLFVCFSHPQGWAIKKNVVTIQLPQFLKFSRQKMGHATCF